MRRWSRLSEVERVELYTRQSLYGVLWSVELVVLISAFNDDDVLGDGTDRALVGATALVVSLAATRVLRRVMTDHPAATRVPWDVAWPLPLLAAAALVVLLPLAQEGRVAGALLVVTPIACALAGLRSRRDNTALAVACAGYVGLVGWAWGAALVAVVLTGFFVFTVRVSLWVLDVATQLDRARDTGARLAVAEERLRFSRDVHDVLGRRLSTIAVQSELAATLAERGDPRAAEQMMTVRGTAHDALREARELARGYRPTDLGHELDGARSLLRSAGIEVDLDVDDVPAAWHEPAAWVIREAVTNVLRHSAARWVRLCWSEDELSIENDGVRAAAGSGAGLVGLRERLAPLGAELETERTDDRFALRVRFPDEAAT